MHLVSVSFKAGEWSQQRFLVSLCSRRMEKISFVKIFAKTFNLRRRQREKFPHHLSEQQWVVDWRFRKRKKKKELFALIASASSSSSCVFRARHRRRPRSVGLKPRPRILKQSHTHKTTTFAKSLHFSAFKAEGRSRRKFLSPHFEELEL